jgi:hypothetical protein
MTVTTWSYAAANRPTAAGLFRQLFANCCGEVAMELTTSPLLHRWTLWHADKSGLSDCLPSGALLEHRSDCNRATLWSSKTKLLQTKTFRNCISDRMRQRTRGRLFIIVNNLHEVTTRGKNDSASEIKHYPSSIICSRSSCMLRGIMQIS